MQTRHVLSIDVGGTTTKLALVRVSADNVPTILDHVAIDTLPQQDAAPFVRRLAEAARPLVASAGSAVSPVGAGVGCPGLIDARRGIVTFCANIPHLTGFPLRDQLAAALGVGVELQNDASATAVGEFLFGKSRGVQNLLVLTLGTGVGGGVIADGHLLCGADNAAAELGHVTVDYSADAAKCGCGKSGCLEAYAGLSGIRRIALRHLAPPAASPAAPPAAPPVASATSLKSEALTTREITEAAARGDTTALAILREVGDYLGRGIATFIDTLNPERIVIGGGAAPALQYLMPGIRASLQKHCCSAVTRDRAVIERSAISDTVVFLGPAAVFLNASQTTV